MTPELFSPAWFSALASIIVIDLILAGDNAIVIGLAARNVPVALQRKVIMWGTVGAIIVRALLTAIVVWLLKIPGFLLVGGLALVYVGWKLTHDGGGKDDHGDRREVAPSAAPCRRSSSPTPSWAWTTCSRSAARRTARCCWC